MIKRIFLVSFIFCASVQAAAPFASMPVFTMPTPEEIAEMQRAYYALSPEEKAEQERKAMAALPPEIKAQLEARKVATRLDGTPYEHPAAFSFKDFIFPSVIESEKIILKKMVKEDIPVLAAAYSESVGNELGLQFNAFFTKEMWLQAMLQLQLQDMALFYTIIDKETNTVIGEIDARGMGHEMEGQYGIWINEKFWGRGLGIEAMHMFFKEFFKVTGFSRLNGFVRFSNERSQKAHKKAGFVHVANANVSKQLIYEITPEAVV